MAVGAWNAGQLGASTLASAHPAVQFPAHRCLGLGCWQGFAHHGHVGCSWMPQGWTSPTPSEASGHIFSFLNEMQTWQEERNKPKKWESCCPGLCLVPQLIGTGGKLYPLSSHGARARLIPMAPATWPGTRCCIPVGSLSCPPGLLAGLSWARFDR